MTGATWLWARSDVRRRWRALLALTVIGGLGAGFVLTTLIGAHRASTAWERFRLETLDSDAFVSIPSRSDPAVADELARLPGVETATSFVYVAVSPPGIPQGGAFAAADDRLDRTISRRRVLEGRRADPGRADEVTVNPSMAAAARLHAGDHTRLEGSNGFSLDVTVVGVVLGANDLGVNAELPAVFLTPAFVGAHGAAVDTGRVNQFVRLDRGTGGVGEFTRAVTERFGTEGGVLVGDTSEESSGIVDALRLQAIAMALLGAAAGAATLLVLRQGLARHAALAAADVGTLGALGMTRRDRTVALSFSAGLVAVASTALATVAAVCASPLVPTGLAGTVEPDPGVKVDPLVLVGGGVLYAVLLATAGVSAARRTMRTRSASGLSSIALPASVGVATTVGLRNALGGGGPRVRAAARSAIAAVLVGSLAFTAAATFAASLDHLLSRKALFGWNFDAIVSVEDADPALGEAALTALVGDPDVTRVTDTAVEFASIGDENVETLVLDPRKGSPILPTLTAGRAPAGAGEIVLGSKTMRRLGVRLGQAVDVAGIDGPVKLVVVGEGVFPVVGDGAMTDAAAISAATAPGLRLETSRGRALMLAVRHGVDPLAVVARHTELLAEAASAPAEVKNLDLVRAAPWLLAAFLAVLGAAAVGHALVSSVRAGRHDLAVLRALGFVRRQVQATVFSQALAITAIGLTVGVPVGLATGRWIWTVVAERTGAIVEPVFAFGVIVATVPLAFVVATVVAAMPARAAGRQHAAAVLRTE